ncbi:hypothetical protein BD410DRAFT_786323 [Rickenella mellea]|uniref:Uncharacterized protein n=1 Tax=Rickenella mellea TaxID=50990 RepID=A0A4Y7QAW4_9AGAM|nr:hypothetical protein BD410DRAFT_786323 [Rickenella mellea]
MSVADELPHDVVANIQRILNIQEGSDVDPLESLSPNFDPAVALNRLFPDEASLSQIGAVQSRLKQNELQLQAEIDALCSELQKDHDPNKMQLIQEMISDLMGQMSRIREQATESEAVVRNITKDIQMLDLAKKNLILSMTTLKRFQMLANAISQLEEFIKEKKYADVAQTLAAVKQLSSSFKPYLSVPRISQVWAHIQTLQGELRTKLDQDFDAFFLPDPARPVKHSLISSACAAVDVLGVDVRNTLLERYCGIELREYRRVFRPSDEAGQLDNLTRRFAFFRRVLQAHETEHAQVFPTEWCVGQRLCAKFMDITRDDISILLEKAGPKLTVSVLLDTLQQVMDFETYVSQKYGVPISEILNLGTVNNSRQTQSIASAFEPHLGVFVDAQDKALADMLSPHRGHKSKPSLEIAQDVSKDGESASVVTVLPSSTELFYFYGQNLEQCAKLSRGKSLYDLCILHKKWLKIYAEDVLLAGMKRPVSHPRRSMEVRFDVNELRHACLILNTADYCQTTALELEEKIQQKIQDDYKDKVSFQAERDLFINVISNAIMVLLRELESACEGSFASMAKAARTNAEHVSGSSAYVGDLINSIDQVTDITRPLVEQKKYLRNFLDKAAGLIIVRFTNGLVKSRPLKEVGAEQLLFDIQALKACLLKLPGGEPSTVNTYGKGVVKSTTRLETLLKVIITPTDPPEGFILNYILLIGDASFSNFQKVLDLKGTPKTEQGNLLDQFVTMTSTRRELENTSFLSSLDMEPSSTLQTGGLVSPGGSRVSLPGLLAGSAAAEGIFTALGSPPLSGPPTGSDTPPKPTEPAKREVFSDLRRFVSFGLRRDASSTS